MGQGTLTYNPGRNQQAQETASYPDVRELKWQLKAAGISLATEADERIKGPTAMALLDPDGNPVPIDRHRG